MYRYFMTPFAIVCTMLMGSSIIHGEMVRVNFTGTVDSYMDELDAFPQDVGQGTTINGYFTYDSEVTSNYEQHKPDRIEKIYDMQSFYWSMGSYQKLYQAGSNVYYMALTFVLNPIDGSGYTYSTVSKDDYGNGTITSERGGFRFDFVGTTGYDASPPEDWGAFVSGHAISSSAQLLHAIESFPFDSQISRARTYDATFEMASAASPTIPAPLAVLGGGAAGLFGLLRRR